MQESLQDGRGLLPVRLRYPLSFFDRQGTDVLPNTHSLSCDFLSKLRRLYGHDHSE